MITDPPCFRKGLLFVSPGIIAKNYKIFMLYRDLLKVFCGIGTAKTYQSDYFDGLQAKRTLNTRFVFSTTFS